MNEILEKEFKEGKLAKFRFTNNDFLEEINKLVVNEVFEYAKRFEEDQYDDTLIFQSKLGIVVNRIADKYARYVKEQTLKIEKGEFKKELISEYKL